jgi:uncharacterized membrane protein
MGHDLSISLENTWTGFPNAMRLAVTMIPVIFASVLPIAYPLRTRRKVKGYLEKHGALGLMLRDFLSMVFFELVVAMGILVIIGWFLIFGLVPLILLGILMLHVKSNEWLYKQAMSKEKPHWFFQVTAVCAFSMIGAVFIAFGSHPYLIGTIVLILVTTPVGAESARFVLGHLASPTESDKLAPKRMNGFLVWFKRKTVALDNRYEEVLKAARRFAAL